MWEITKKFLQQAGFKLCSDVLIAVDIIFLWGTNLLCSNCWSFYQELLQTFNQLFFGLFIYVRYQVVQTLVLDAAAIEGLGFGADKLAGSFGNINYVLAKLGK